MNAKEVGERIRYFREKANIKKGTLATRSGISPTYINDLESGRKCPTVETLGYICSDGLGITLTEFFSNAGNQTQSDLISSLTPAQKALLNEFLNSFNSL